MLRRRSIRLGRRLLVLIASASLLAACASDAKVVGAGPGGAGGATTAGTAQGGSGAETTSSAGGAPNGTAQVGPTGSTSTASTASGGGSPAGDCATDADCPQGKCVAVTDGGYKICAAAIEEATACSGQGLDECCDSSECDPGLACYLGPLTNSCGGAQPLVANVCAKDQCQTSADCDEGYACAAPGTMGNPVALCLFAYCRVSADCTREPGGYCAPFSQPCCSGPTALACIYPDVGCRSSSDCKQGEFCYPLSDGSTGCSSATPQCPP